VLYSANTDPELRDWLSWTPPLPISMPCSIACRAAKSFNAPACSASRRILSGEENVSFRGSGVFRSASRNWQHQPLLCMKLM